jgi:hypothetical protein
MSTTSEYRALTQEEIALLESGGSRAAEWRAVRIAHAFDAARVVRCTFSGEVTLGAFNTTVATLGADVPAGVYDSRLHNVSVGDGALVDRVALLSNMDVGPGAVVSQCGDVVVEGEPAFGNGVAIDVLNEAGGREIRVFDRLSAQIAYLHACYRHRAALVKRLDEIVATYVALRRSKRGSIGSAAQLRNCAKLRNVCVGPHAIVDGAVALVNGTINSNEQAPTLVGAGVVASDFVVSTGSVVDGGAALAKCFVGQSCRIGRQFSAEACAFFANCEGFHGEAVSMLAGPYTVTHHKSTLLIAATTSFYNAGSGTNQSNHMYKMGPVHQGILERGSKTGSFSYLLWPAHVGAFTAVIGKHYTNFDTHNLPFSYIFETDGRSMLSPAINLFTVGTRRDGDKWPQRDRRTDSDVLDLIHFEVFSPYTIGRVLKGLAEITEIYEKAPREQDLVNYHGLSMKRLLCHTAKKHYDVALKVYFGRLLAERLEDSPGRLPAPGRSSDREWVDMLGLLAPKADVEALCDAVEDGSVADLGALESRLRLLHGQYRDAEWAWANDAYKEMNGRALHELDAGEQAGVIAAWRDARVKLNAMIQTDAEKEYAQSAKIGYGIDGDEATREADFAAVRGVRDENPFIVGLQKDSADTTARAERILAALGSSGESE